MEIARGIESRHGSGSGMTALSYFDNASRKWDVYGIEFESPDGVYMVTLYAISLEHAHLQLQALKETGKVMGQIDQFIPADDYGDE